MDIIACLLQYLRNSIPKGLNALSIIADWNTCDCCTRATQGNTFAHADADTKANLITEGSGINLHEDFTLFSSGGLIKERKKIS